QSVEPLTRDRPGEATRAKAVAGRFLKGDGATLHATVVKNDACRRSGYPHSYVEKLWDDMYLEGRWSLPVNTNPYIAIQPPPKHAAVAPAGSDLQIEGATRFISSLLKWNRRVHDGTFEHDLPPACLHGYALQCGTARVAFKGRDKVEFYPAARHAAVFCNNRVFRVDLLGGEDADLQISEGDLRKAFQGIRTAAFSERGDRSSGPSLGDAFAGHFTTMGRDEWATSRAALAKFSEVNRATLFEIDSALIAIALDDHDTPGNRDEARTFLTGVKGRNRWFDKHQLVVLKNGSMAVNFEHSFSDGMAWVRMLGEIWHDMYGVPGKGIKPFPKAPLLSSPPPPPRELSWKIPPELKAEVISASRAFGEACAGYTLEHVEFLDFGKNACKEWKISPDAVAQMAFHLAFRRLHGMMPSTYESCSTRAFFHGRTEVIRTCTSESADFASTMEKGSTGKDTRRAALDLAATKHIMLAKAASQGQGIDRHLLAIKAVAEEIVSDGGGVRLGAVFLDDPLVAETSAWRLSTSNLSLPFLKCFGCGATNRNGYGLVYIWHEDKITFPVTAFQGAETDGKILANEIVRALGEIGKVCR
ncbi:unnamed protein product, partial [Ascophyllum nodosum]